MGYPLTPEARLNELVLPGTLTSDVPLRPVDLKGAAGAPCSLHSGAPVIEHPRANMCCGKACHRYLQMFKLKHEAAITLLARMHPRLREGQPLGGPGTAEHASGCKWCKVCPRWPPADQGPISSCHRPDTEHTACTLRGMQGSWPAGREMRSSGGAHSGHETTSVLRCTQVQIHTWLKFIRRTWIPLKIEE